MPNANVSIEALEKCRSLLKHYEDSLEDLVRESQNISREVESSGWDDQRSDELLELLDDTKRHSETIRESVEESIIVINELIKILESYFGW